MDQLINLPPVRAISTWGGADGVSSAPNNNTNDSTGGVSSYFITQGFRGSEQSRQADRRGTVGGTLASDDN
ncbi:unnamed protein product [Ceratitis capitata]|uniref:(Mediterranean fruit fly) hypothetical protein n=1 Tax=Ceratitis capitata TaxID=7213 RepID=A0A811UZG9_CERCA|nr:unnamed protein product [Ceratitis capitata]